MRSFAAGPVAEESFAWSSECWLDINGREEFWDDVNGGWLDPTKVKAARAEELELMVKRGVFIKVPELECSEVARREAGRPNSLQLDATSGVSQDAGERYGDRGPRQRRANSHKTHGDMGRVKSALLRRGREREVYTNLPEEMAQEGFVAKLQHTMYGTQDASNIWGETWAKHLNKADLVEGKASRALFRGAGVKYFCHEDDFVGLGEDEDLDKFGAHLKKAFDLRPSTKIGFGECVEKVMTVLNRKVIIDDEEKVVNIEADEKHVPNLLEKMGLLDAKAQATPRVKRTAAEQKAIDNSLVLEGKQVTLYRSGTMRLKYLDQGRMGLTESVKVLAQAMSQPR